jgi:chemotaxis protein CheX
MSTSLGLPAKCDTAAADLLLEQIKSRRGAPLCIDAQGCGGIGAICAAILLSAQRSWRSDGVEFSLVSAAELVADLTLLGVADGLLEMEPVK